MAIYSVSLFTYLVEYADDVWIHSSANLGTPNGTTKLFVDKALIDFKDPLKSFIHFANCRLIDDYRLGCLIQEIFHDTETPFDSDSLEELLAEQNEEALLEQSEQDNVGYGKTGCCMAFHLPNEDEDLPYTMDYKDALNQYYKLLQHLYREVKSYERHSN